MASADDRPAPPRAHIALPRVPTALPRVLLMAPHFAPETGAGAVRLSSLAAELARLGHDVDVVAPEIPGRVSVEDYHPGVRVEREQVDPRRPGMLGNLLWQRRLRRGLERAAARVVERARPDVVICSSPPPLAALAGIAAARLAHAPLIVDLRDLWPDVLIEAGTIGRRSPAANVLRWIENRLLEGAAAVTTVTSTKQDRLRARTPRPVHLVPNGVDGAWLDGGPAYAGGGEDGPFELLYAGNIGRAQDVALMAKVVAGLETLRDRGALPERVAGRSFQATIVGDGESRAEVERLVARWPRAISLLAPESRDDVRQRLAGCGAAS